MSKKTTIHEAGKIVFKQIKEIIKVIKEIEKAAQTGDLELIDVKTQLTSLVFSCGFFLIHNGLILEEDMNKHLNDWFNENGDKNE